MNDDFNDNDYDPNVFNPPPNDESGEDPYMAGYMPYSSRQQYYGDPAKIRRYTWFEAWKEALLNPSEESYRSLLNDPQFSLDRAIIWIVIATAIGFVLNAIARFFYSVALGGLFFSGSDADQFSLFAVSSATDSIFSIICCLPFYILIVIMLFFIYFGVVHGMSRMLGGQGKFEPLLYGQAAIYAPMTLINAMLSFIPIGGSCLSITVVLAYQIYLMALMTKTVHRFGWGEGFLAVIAPFIAIFGCCCALVMAVIVLATA